MLTDHRVAQIVSVDGLTRFLPRPHANVPLKIFPKTIWPWLLTTLLQNYGKYLTAWGQINTDTGNDLWQKSCNFCQCAFKTRPLRTAPLGHVGAAAAGSPYQRGQMLHDVTGRIFLG